MGSAKTKVEPTKGELLTELKNLRQRFVRCLEHSGTDTEYALAAVTKADELIARAEGRQEQS